MCLPPANARIWPNPLLYSAVYHRYSLKSFQLCKSAQTYSYRKYFEHIVARFQRDSSCLTTIDNIKPELCRNSAPLYNPMSVVDNSALLFFHSSHFNCNNNKFNPLSRVLKENINKIYKMQHFTTLENAAYTSFSKHSVLIPRGQSVSAVTGGVEYFREDRQHTISLRTRLCTCAVLSSRKYSTPPVTADTLCSRGISTECFEKLVSSISKGGKMLHFVYFVYVFF